MVGNIRSLCVVLVLVLSSVTEILVMQRLFSVFDMEYLEVLLISVVPIVLLVSFVSVIRSVWEK